MKVIKINRIIVRNAGLIIKYKNLEKIRAQVAAVFGTSVDNILFNYEEMPETTKTNKTVNINSKNVF